MNKINPSNRDFKGVWIPKEIYLNNDLNWTEKILFVEISSLDNQQGCFARNKHFAEFLGKSESYISKCISKLKKLGFIQEESFDGRKRKLTSNYSYGKSDNQIGSKQSSIGAQGSVSQGFKAEKVENGDTTVSKGDKMASNNTVNNTTNNKKDSCSDSESQNDKVKFDKESKPYQLAMHLKKKIKSNVPNQPVPKNSPKQMESWSLAMDRLHRLGTVGGNSGYSWDKIKDIIDWCQQDDFWYKNILSASKLRKQAVKLEMRMKEDNGYQPNKQEEKIDYYADLRE